MIEFQKESIKTILEDGKDLISSHWREISLHHGKVNLNVAHDQYLQLEEIGCVHVISARDDGKLVGYCVMLVMPHLHYCEDLFAFNDAVYIHPSYRNGTVGIKLIKETEEYMSDIGVSVMTVHVKPTKDFSPILKRIGFSEFETVYSKYVGE